jgi:hypothetical protein
MVPFTVALFVLSGALGQAQEGPAELSRIKSEYADVLALQGTAKAEVLAIARILRAKPAMAVDRTPQSGEYCLKTSDASMVHFASEWQKTKEDVIYEFNATPLIQAGLDPKKLDVLPALGLMSPGRWYFLEEGKIDPHHRHPMSGPFLLISEDVH